MDNASKALYDFIVNRTHPVWKNKLGFLSIDISENVTVRFLARDDKVGVQFQNKTDNANTVIDIHSFNSNEPLESIRVHYGGVLVFSGDVDKARSKPNEIEILNVVLREDDISKSGWQTKDILNVGKASVNLLLLTLKSILQNNSLDISLPDFGYVAF